MTLEGGCACGAIRYRILDENPRDCGYCHCRICQRTSGAPVMVFATVKRSSLALSGDEPRVYPSSNVGERWFCALCGAQFAMRDFRAPDDIEIAVASLDDPAAVAPGFHIWISSQVPWFETKDDLPRHERDRPIR
jgi:hypothetical protein